MKIYLFLKNIILFIKINDLFKKKNKNISISLNFRYVNYIFFTLKLLYEKLL
jgi:hypothetical protein